MNNIENLVNEALQKAADKKAGQKKPYKFKQGQTKVRLLPSWRVGDDTFHHNYGESWIKNMDDNVLAVAVDQQITFNTSCNVRHLIGMALAEARTDAQRAHYKEMLAKPRVLVNALVLDDKTINPNVPEIVDLSETQFVSILKQAKLGDILKDGEFIDLERGFDLIVDRSGEGFDTVYQFTFARKATRVDPEVMKTINDIDAYIRAKLQDTERAVNAIKTITQSNEVLALNHTGPDYDLGTSGNTRHLEDADYSIVEDAKTPTEDNVFDNQVLSEDDIAKLFASD